MARGNVESIGFYNRGYMGIKDKKMEATIIIGFGFSGCGASGL